MEESEQSCHIGGSSRTVCGDHSDAKTDRLSAVGRTRRRRGQRETTRTPKGALGKSKLDGKEQDIRALLGKDASKASMACAGKDQRIRHEEIKDTARRPHIWTE